MTYQTVDKEVNRKSTKDQYIKKINHLMGKSIVGFRLRAQLNVDFLKTMIYYTSHGRKFRSHQSFFTIKINKIND